MVPGWPADQFTVNGPRLRNILTALIGVKGYFKKKKKRKHESEVIDRWGRSGRS